MAAGIPVTRYCISSWACPRRYSLSTTLGAKDAGL